MRFVEKKTKAALFFALLSATYIAPSAVPSAARAFDFFGLFDADEPPPPSPTTLPYRVEFVTHGGEVVDALQDSSSLFKLRQDPPPDEETLVQRINADFAPMTDALWALGYYNARIFVSIGDVTVLELDRGNTDKLGQVAKDVQEPSRRSDHHHC